MSLTIAGTTDSREGRNCQVASHLAIVDGGQREGSGLDTQMHPQRVAETCHEFGMSKSARWHDELDIHRPNLFGLHNCVSSQSGLGHGSSNLMG